MYNATATLFQFAKSCSDRMEKYIIQIIDSLPKAGETITADTFVGARVGCGYDRRAPVTIKIATVKPLRQHPSIGCRFAEVTGEVLK